MWFRAVIGIWSLWFTAALVEAPGVHECAVHSGAVAHAAMPAMDMASHTNGDGTEPSHSPDSGSCPCTCLGLCCGATPVVAPTYSLDFASRTTIATALRIAFIASVPGISRRYARPFANGPPAAA